jgi:dimethylhistidine N-methyltransferase
MRQERVVIEHALTPAETAEELAAFARDVHYYLSLDPKQLPSKYLYDNLGSALFDAICELPWYGITRAERRLLQRVGGEIMHAAGPLRTIVELGPGSGVKLKTLIASGGADVAPNLEVHLIDLSGAALSMATRTIGELGVARIVPHRASYETGFERASQSLEPGPAMVALLGSNIGNFDPPGAEAFLGTIHRGLAPGDAILIGVDLVKSERELLDAYDDPLGVTAAFNRNLLVRINRELGGHVDVRQFGHRALWNGEESRVEMHLVSRVDQGARVEACDLTIEFREGETIWTESSYKYHRREIETLLERSGFLAAGQWIDHADGFSLTLGVRRAA